MAVCKAIHIRAGRREDVEAVDGWLHDHGMEVVPLANVYAACAFLLKHFDYLPDFALLGVDWLSADELKIVRYVRETWPRVGIIVYGAGPETAALGYSARMLSCRSGHELAKLTARRPEDVLAELRGDVVPLRRRPQPLPQTPTPAHEPRPLANAPAAQASAPHDNTERGRAAEQRPAPRRSAPKQEAVEPRTILTAAELAALLETDEDS